MVYVHLGAAADFAGVLRGMQERPEPAREGQRSNSPWVVGSKQDTNTAEHAQLEGGSHLESCTGHAGRAFDVGSSHEGAGAGCY